MPTVLGIDEAGRGAVLGPLIVAGILADVSATAPLRAAGARDSKAVPRARRRELVRALVPHVHACRVIVVPPAVIDGEGLTGIELKAIAELIERLQPDRVVLDAPVGPNAIPRFVSLLRRNTPNPPPIEARPRADVSDPMVGAASLLAKVVRDAYMAVLQRAYGDIGWGYPGEPKVRAFLEGWLADHGHLPPVCRTRWGSLRPLITPMLPLCM